MKNRKASCVRDTIRHLYVNFHEYLIIIPVDIPGTGIQDVVPCQKP